MGTTVKAFTAISIIALSGLANTHAQEVEPLELSVTVGAHFTDNRDSRPDELAVDNIDFRVSPKIGYHLEAKEDSRTDLYWAPGYRFRTEPADLQNDSEWHHDLGIDINRKVSRRLRLVFTEHFNYTDDPSITSEGDTLRQDGSFVYNNLYGSAHIDVVRLHQIRIGARHRLKDYEDDTTANRSNEEILDFNAGYWHALSPKQHLLVDITVQAVDYDTDFNIDRGFGSIAYGVGYEHDFTKRMHATIRAGIRDVDYDDDNVEDSDSPYFTAVGSYNVADDLRLTGSFYAETREADAFPFSSQDYTGFTLRADKVYSRKFRANLLAQYRNGSYDADSVPLDTPDEAFVKDREGDETTLVFRGEVSWTVQENQYISLSYQIEETESDVDESYDRNAGSLSWFLRF